MKNRMRHIMQDVFSINSLFVCRLAALGAIVPLVFE